MCLPDSVAPIETQQLLTQAAQTLYTTPETTTPKNTHTDAINTLSELGLTYLTNGTSRAIFTIDQSKLNAPFPTIVKLPLYGQDHTDGLQQNANEHNLYTNHYTDALLPILQSHSEHYWLLYPHAKPIKTVSNEIQVFLQSLKNNGYATTFIEPSSIGTWNQRLYLIDYGQFLSPDTTIWD